VGVYLFPLVGALASDGLLGKYNTILCFSALYCAGHVALAFNQTRRGLAVGLALIAIGSGGIKPCASANVGDQFCSSNLPLLPRVYGFFYLSINLGALTSSLITPYLLEAAGSHVAFGVPGLIMAIATLIFWAGRYSFAHIPPAGLLVARRALSRSGRQRLGRLLTVYAFLAVFWSLYDQSVCAQLPPCVHLSIAPQPRISMRFSRCLGHSTAGPGASHFPARAGTNSFMPTQPVPAKAW
jgi:POT family proton-dependent oligopeptide transporter